jgi:uncharacterized spore protein YtfJ
MEHIVEMLDLISGNLSSVAKSDVVVGEPIELGRVTVVPLSRVSVGMGGGGGEGEGDFPPPSPRGKDKGRKRPAGGGKGTGGGTGGGAKVRPVGVIIFSEDGVEIQPIKDKKGIFDMIFEKVPEVMDMVKKAQEKTEGG